MADTGADLLAGILANPEDMGRRLVYADWLEENGEEERASFVRGQCLGQRVQVRLPLIREWVPWLGKRTLSAVWARWHCTIKHVDARGYGGGIRTAPAPGRVVFRGGFISEVRCLLSEWLVYGSQMVRQHPIRCVHMVDKTPHDSAALSHEWFNYDHLLGAERIDATDALPGAVFALLPDSTLQTLSAKLYATRQEAEDALANALLAWASLPF